MDPIDYERLDTALQEVLRLRPPLTPAQGASRRKADLEIDEKYAGNHVAYIDTWNGDELERTVVAVSSEAAGFQTELAKLPPHVREKVQIMYLPPADVLLAPFAQLG